MNIVEKNLRELNITLPDCPTPVAAYVPAVRAGNFVFASGQTPIAGGNLVYKGKLGQDLGIEEGYEAARLAAIRVIAELKSVVGDLDRIARIVKVTGYVNSAWISSLNAKGLSVSNLLDDEGAAFRNGNTVTMDGFVAAGLRMIQCDYPALMDEYLRGKGKR